MLAGPAARSRRAGFCIYSRRHFLPHIFRFLSRYAPDIDLILKEISQYREKGYLSDVLNNINKFFERVSSQGCLLIEQESGPDEYIHDIRQDIFDRFKSFRKALQGIDE